MPRSTVFTINRSQAVRLPKDVAFPETVQQVDVIPLGSARLLTPVGHRWDDFFAQPGLGEGFPAERAQGDLDERPPL